MAIYFILRHFIGFALQMTPATLLLLLPFDPVCFRLPAKRQWLAFIGVSLGLSAIYSGLAYATYTVNPDAGFLFGNAFMIAASPWWSPCFSGSSTSGPCASCLWFSW